MIPGRITLFIALLGCLSVFSPGCADALSDDDADRALYSAESLFQAMKYGQYTEIWSSLTAKTQKSVVNAVYKAEKKAGTPCDPQTIEADFARGGVFARRYWDQYTAVFKPDMVLEESQWSLGASEQDRLEILIQYKKSERPAVLQLFREEGRWKVGLDETFGARELLPF